MDAMEKSLKSNGKFRLDLSDVKTMTLSGNLTGDSVATYAPNPAIQPAQSINFRDLIPTVRSSTGLYVYYRENAGLTNNIANQTEGSDKGENNYSLTEYRCISFRLFLSSQREFSLVRRIFHDILLRCVNTIRL